jgi:O-acetyl-ADP-ribose deacetylase (regulator of RNase III)
VIHTVGPVYQADVDKSEQLRDCYLNSLVVADELGAASVAFPLISAGAFGWPTQDAIRQALNALRDAPTGVREARLVLFGADTFALAQGVAAEILRS